MTGLSPNQPLPPNPFDESHEESCHSAYNRCLKMEHDHLDLDDIYLVHARCLGCLITELPSKGREAVAKEVNLCGNTEGELNMLSEYYIRHVIRPFKGNKGCTTAMTPPEEGLLEMHPRSYEEVAQLAPRDHTTAKELALRRDNYRCVVTGFADLPSFDVMTPDERQRWNLLAPNVSLTETQYCHIFRPTTVNDSAEEKKSWASSVWDIMESFGPVDPMVGSNFHDLTTGFTLAQDLCSAFDRLFLWFEYLPNHPQPNTYRVCSAVALRDLAPDRTVTFTSMHPSLPPPSPKYLQLHAVICRVARLSGAGHYVEQEEWEIQMAPVLAGDGSSADLLTSRLKCLLIAV